MATKRQAERLVEVAPNGDAGRYVVPPMAGLDVDDGDVDLNEMADLLDIPGAARADVYRIEPRPPGSTTNKPYFCGKLTPPFGLDLVQENWGGGVFNVLFIDERGRRVANRRIAIEGAPKVAIVESPAPSRFQAYEPRRFDEPQPLVPVQQADPMLLSLMQKFDMLLTTLAQQNQSRPSMSERLEEMKLMAETMRGFVGTPKNEPEEFAKWMRHGYRLRAELADSVQQPADDGWVGQLVASIPQILAALQMNRRAAAAGRASSSARRAVASPPVAAGQLTAEVKPAEPVVSDENKAIPKWIQRLGREFARCAKQEDDDPEFMAGWISRNIPGRVLAQMESMQPSEVRSQLMQLTPVVQAYGQVLNEDFVTEVVRVLFMRDDDSDDDSPARELDAAAFASPAPEVEP